jgi:hypothetical protein
MTKKNTARDEEPDAEERATAELKVNDPPPDVAGQALARLMADALTEGNKKAWAELLGAPEKVRGTRANSVLIDEAVEPLK